MALRALMTKKKLEEKRKALDEIRAKKQEFELREAELEKAIEEASTDEEKAVVEEEVGKFETEKKENEDAEKTLEGEVSELEKELADIETEVEEPTETEVPKEEKREVKITMNKRNLFADMGIQERTAFFEDENVKNWLGEVRSAIKEKRSINNVGLTIPEVVLPLLKENIEGYSKLYSKVNVKSVGGEARQNIMGTISEAIWTECCSNLNELDLGFNDWSVDCFKVGGYYAICNANVEDSDYDLASEVITAIGQGIGLALDKAILFGRNTNQNSKMPLGVLVSLAQTSQPADYPATARTWVDLHTSNIKSINASGLNLFKAIIEDSGVISNKYGKGAITWVMNEKTYKHILAESLSVNAAGAMVAGVNSTMPIVGGDIVTEDFMPDNIIAFGYFDLYLLAERAGNKFASSEHVRFLQDQTVYKGTARYDGAPIIREAFGVLQLGEASLDVTDITFPQDSANPTSI